MQLTQDQLRMILGYDQEGIGRVLPPEIEQWLASQQQTTAPELTYNGDVNPQSRDVTTYSFGNTFGNQFGEAPIGPDGQPLWIPSEQRSVGETLGRMALTLGGAAALGNAPLLFGGMGGGGGAAAAGAPMSLEAAVAGLPSYGAAPTIAESAAAFGAAPEVGGMFSGAAAGGGAPAATSALGGSGAGPLGGSTFGAAAGGAGNFLTPGAGASLLGTGAAAASSLFGNPNLLGAGVGALAGALGSGDTTQTSQTLMDPSARAYLDSFRGRAEQVASQPYQAPTFSLTQGPTGAQTQGMAGMQDAMASPMTGQANSLFSGFMDGSRDGTAARNPYAGPNTYLDPMIEAAQGDLSRAYANTVAPKFSSGSSFGNSGLGFAEVDSRNDLMRNLGQIGTNMRFADYNLQAGLGEQSAARQDSMFTGNQNRALQAGQLGQAGVRDQANMANALFGQGSTLWNQGQQNIDNQWAQFTNQQDYARNQLSAMNPGLGVGMNAGTSSTTPGNPWAGALGGAVLGSQFGNWMSGGNQRTPTSIFG